MLAFVEELVGWGEGQAVPSSTCGGAVPRQKPGQAVLSYLSRPWVPECVGLSPPSQVRSLLSCVCKVGEDFMKNQI